MKVWVAEWEDSSAKVYASYGALMVELIRRGVTHEEIIYFGDTGLYVEDYVVANEVEVIE